MYESCSYARFRGGAVTALGPRRDQREAGVRKMVLPGRIETLSKWLRGGTNGEQSAAPILHVAISNPALAPAPVASRYYFLQLWRSSLGASSRCVPRRFSRISVFWTTCRMEHRSFIEGREGGW